MSVPDLTVRTCVYVFARARSLGSGPPRCPKIPRALGPDLVLHFARKSLVEVEGGRHRVGCTVCCTDDKERRGRQQHASRRHV